MKFLFVADLHYALKQFDWLVANAADFDPVVIGGDLLDLGSDLDFDVQIVVVEKYLERIRQKTRLLVSSGNHDGDARNAADESVAEWIQGLKGDGVLVDGQSLEVPGGLVTICPWWDGPASRAEIEAQLERESRKAPGKWIWIHHAPPASSPVCWTGRKFAGDEWLLGWIQRFSPTLVLSGHIHNSPFYPEGSWVGRIGKSWVCNPGRQLGASPTHIIFNLDAMTLEWFSTEGASIQPLAVD